VRDKGELVGYFVGFVAPGLHYQTCLTCHMDILYLRPDKRGAMGGVLLMKAVKEEAKRRGVQRMFVGTKAHKNIGRLFEKMGFSHVETTYSAWIGD
jgi:N-acetylglutamate synthase-like GNAT family acetyltransferase